MKLNYVFHAPVGYAPPLPSKVYCTPEDLAELLIYDRQFVRQTWGEGAEPPLSEAGIKSLVNLVFYASSFPDEGRFPRFKISTGAVLQVAEFDRVHLDGPNALRRLAPACTHPECALRVIESPEGDLYCNGVVNLGPMGWEWTPGYPGFSAVGNLRMYELTVRDPGHIVATASGGGSYELRAGNIRRLYPYLALDPVKALHDDFVSRIKEEISQKEGEEATKLFGGVGRYTWPDGFHNIFSRILRAAIEARHGGTFVVLPDSTSPEACEIKLRYRAKVLDLGQNAINFWIACTEYDRANTNRSLLQRCNAVRTKMLVDAKAVGNLSAVDGCVVLDRHLRVLGFGGIIQVSESDAKTSNRPFQNAVSGEEWPYDEFMKGIGGTRHQSAARLCRVHQGVLVFVVSQDGDLKLLCSDREPPQVNGYGPLDLPAFDDSRF